MMISEFIERTDFTPTMEEYGVIENDYYDYAGDIDAFCKNWKKTGGIQKLTIQRAERIEELKMQLERQKEESNKKEVESSQQIIKLKAELDKELEWKPCDGGTTVSQTEYEELLNFSSEIVTEEEAKDILYREFGFSPEKVVIFSEVSTYEANRHHLMRKAKTYSRSPVYNATDWNYIRFDCAHWQYEFVNGSLRSYRN